MSSDMICEQGDLIPNAGVCALHNGEQVALFYLPDTEPGIYAIGNYDPFGKANVLSRGIVGSIADRLVVASPLLKQHFCLQTGQCIEDESQKLHVWPVQVNGDRVQLAG